MFNKIKCGLTFFLLSGIHTKRKLEYFHRKDNDVAGYTQTGGIKKCIFANRQIHFFFVVRLGKKICFPNRKPVYNIYANILLLLENRASWRVIELSFEFGSHQGSLVGRRITRRIFLYIYIHTTSQWDSSWGGEIL